MIDALTVLRELHETAIVCQWTGKQWDLRVRQTIARLEREQAEAKREEELNDHGPCD